MHIKKWKKYFEQTTPVTNDTTTEEELAKRNEDLERIKSEVTEITNTATNVNSSTDAENIRETVESMINNFAGENDSFITLALSYLKTIGEKRIIELQLNKYAEQIPELQNQIKARYDEIDSEIDEIRISAES